MNIYEQWTFDELEKSGFAVFVPFKDRGVDCIITGKEFQGRPQKIQIKGSRSYEHHAAGWYQFKDDYVQTSGEKTDFWIFVCTKIDSRGRFKPVFLVMPTDELVQRLKIYASKDVRGRHNLYLTWGDPDHKDMVVDTRIRDPWPIPLDDARNYTSFDGKWDMITKAVNS